MMSNVPRLRFKEFSGEWNTTKVSKISNRIVTGGTPSTLEPDYWDNGNIRWMSSGELNYKKVFEVEKRITELGLNKSSTKMIPAHCILIGLAGQGKTRGTVAMNMVELCINQSIAAIHPNSKIFDENFLYHNLDNRYEELRKLSTGEGGRGGLNLQIIKTLDISLPSKPEQEKIASFLTSVDTKIELLVRKEELLQQYKKGVMQKIFSQEIRFKADDGSEYPEWEEYTLGETAKFRRGSFPQPYGLPEWYDEDNGMPFVQVFDVDDNMKLKPSTKNKISKLAQPLSVFVPKGNIVLTIQGSIGRIALTNYDAYVDRTLLIFTDYIQNINRHFFIYIIFLLFEIEKRKAPGGTIKTITKEALTSFIVNLPCLEEQTKIANFLSSIDSKIEHIQNQLNATKAFKKALLQQMFI